MRLEYFHETDTFYIQLRDAPGANAQEVAGDIVLDFSKAGEVVGIEIEHASHHMDLADLHLASIPVTDAPQAS